MHHADECRMQQNIVKRSEIRKMADSKTGKLTQIIGAVLDIKFPEGGCLRSTMQSMSQLDGW